MTTKATFCQLPTTSTASLAVAIRYAYISLCSSLKLRQTTRVTRATVGIGVLNHCLSWFTQGSHP